MNKTTINSKQRTNQEGSVLVVAMVSLVGLLAVGGIAVLASQRTMSVSAHSKFQSSALLAAESGVYTAMDYLSNNIDPTVNWTAFVQPSNIDPNTGQTVPPDLNIPGNVIHAGAAGSLFTADSRMSYDVTILNNLDDPGFDVGEDDGIVMIRSVGHGPNGATVTLEVEIARNGISLTNLRPCNSYAQRGLAEDGAGRNDCLGVVDGTETATMTPGS